jgi:hypothetical protein
MVYLLNMAIFQFAMLNSQRVTRFTELNEFKPVLIGAPVS